MIPSPEYAVNTDLFFWHINVVIRTPKANKESCTEQFTAQPSSQYGWPANTHSQPHECFKDIAVELT